MKIKTVIVGELETNCYIVENEDSCLIIDPGDKFLKIKNNIDKKVIGVLLTHRHFDHVGALEEFVDYYNVPIYDKNNLSNGVNKIGDFELIVNYNPGHTLDSISFIFDNIMFSGDFIFRGCIGRTDLGGDFNLMKESIREILASTVNYKIYPGHGETTMLNHEKEMLNYYLK